MFSLDELRVLQRAMSTYLPASKHRETDTPHVKRLRRLLEQLVNGEGLLPPSGEMPKGEKPSQEAAMRSTIDAIFKPLCFAILNVMRSQPPMWWDLDVAISTTTHAAVYVIQNSAPGTINVDRFARMTIQALAALPLSPALKEHIERTQLVGLIANSPGGQG
jgi:hypothetical protein